MTSEEIEYDENLIGKGIFIFNSMVLPVVLKKITDSEKKTKTKTKKEKQIDSAN